MTQPLTLRIIQATHAQPISAHIRSALSRLDMAVGFYQKKTTRVTISIVLPRSGTPFSVPSAASKCPCEAGECVASRAERDSRGVSGYAAHLPLGAPAVVVSDR